MTTDKTTPVTGILDGTGMVLLTEAQFEAACRTSYDKGALVAIDSLLISRRRHWLRWLLTRGRYDLLMLHGVVTDSLARSGRDL